MSFKGVVEAACPGCKESEEIEVWSFVRGDMDPELRETLLVGELNLVICEHCGEPFLAEATVIYLDEDAGLLAFIFPEAYRGDEARWRSKMKEDFATLRSALPDLRLGEPQILFGFEELRETLRADDAMADEVEVARFFEEKLGFAPLSVDRAFARARNLPWDLPLGRGKPFTRENALEALRALLGANDKLEGYRRWIGYFESSKELPPATLVIARRSGK